MTQSSAKHGSQESDRRTDMTTTRQRKTTAQTKKRDSREQETWDNVDIHDMIIEIGDDDGALPNVPPREGYAQRWIRTMKNGVEDPANIAKAMNAYWRRRAPDTLPEGIAAPSVHVDGIGETIGISGMILMERPLAIHEKFVERVRNRTRTQMEAVDKSLYKIKTAGDSGFGTPQRTEDETKVSVGVGTGFKMPVDESD
jgi:hypothetical protein